MEQVAGSPLAPPTSAPAPDPALLAAAREASDHLDGLMPDDPRSRVLWPGTVADALNRLELKPGTNSPLGSLGDDELGLPIDEVVTDWPSDAWSGALTTLCRPAWLVDLVGCDGETWTRVATYAGAGDTWVIHDHGANSHLVSFPHRPEELLTLLAGFLPDGTAPAAGDRLELTFAQCAALFLLADEARDAPDSETAFETPRWENAVALLLPVETDLPDIDAGLAGLADAGWLTLEDDATTLTPEGEAVLEALGAPRRVVGLRATEFTDDTDQCAHASGFVAVMTDDRIWLCGVAEEWDCESVPPTPRWCW